MFEYFLLQINIHHPGGALENNSSSYAVCWLNWHKCLRSLYGILCNEMDKNLCVRLKNSSLFVTSKNHKMLADIFVKLTVEVCRQVKFIFFALYSKFMIYCLQVFNNKEENMETSFLDQSMDSSFRSKRRKLDVGTRYIIDVIRTTKDWPWYELKYVFYVWFERC